MKNLLLYLATAMALLFTTSLASDGKAVVDSTNTTIDIGQFPPLPINTPKPKNFSISAISCVFNSTSSELVFSFHEDLGIVSLYIHCPSGLIINQTINTQVGVTTIPLTTETGYYQIYIYTTEGDCYYGEFST